MSDPYTHDECVIPHDHAIPDPELECVAESISVEQDPALHSATDVGFYPFKESVDHA